MIECKKVSGAKRDEFLFEMCGASFLDFEGFVYSLAERFSKGEYTGGYWEFFHLESIAIESGFYMQWAGEEPNQEITFTSPNGFVSSMSLDAFSITVNLFALCHFANFENTHKYKFSDYYHLLRYYADDHKEGRLIFSAID